MKLQHSLLLISIRNAKAVVIPFEFRLSSKLGIEKALKFKCIPGRILESSTWPSDSLFKFETCMSYEPSSPTSPIACLAYEFQLDCISHPGEISNYYYVSNM